MDADAGRTTSPRQGLVTRAQLAGETFAFQHPQVTRRALGLVRRYRPVLKVGTTAFVTKHAHVKEVLERDDDFTVEMYTAKMERAVGPFILGMQDGPAYQRDVTNLRAAAPHSDLPRIKEMIEDILEPIMASARARGRLDVVGELADMVPMELSRQYFGVPGPPGGELVAWARAVFYEFFYNSRNDPAISVPAYEKAELLRAHVASVVAARKVGSTSAYDGGPDVLDRMLAMQAEVRPGVDDEWIRAYITGLIIGMLPLTSKVTSMALDAILRNRELLSGARAAVRDGDDDLLWRYVSEAMRFAPQAPGQLRISNGTQTIGANGGRGHTFGPGTRVLAATQPAMFDPEVFAEPSRIRTDRPAEDHLHFGHGLHTCFGHQISEKVQVPSIIAAVLRQPGLRRAPGKAGRLAWKGAFPSRLEVTFDAE